MKLITNDRYEWLKSREDFYYSIYDALIDKDLCDMRGDSGWRPHAVAVDDKLAVVRIKTYNRLKEEYFKRIDDNKEAIYSLTKLLSDCYFVSNYAEYKKAIEMAILALDKCSDSDIEIKNDNDDN